MELCIGESIAIAFGRASCTNVSLIESLAHTTNVRVFARIHFNSCSMNRCTRAVSHRPFRLIATCKMHFTLDGHVDISLVVELSTSMLCCVINSNNNEQQTITSVRNIICQSHGEMDCIDDASRSSFFVASVHRLSVDWESDKMLCKHKQHARQSRRISF